MISIEIKPPKCKECPLFASPDCPRFTNMTQCPICKEQVMVSMKNTIGLLRDPEIIVCESSPLFENDIINKKEVKK